MKIFTCNKYKVINRYKVIKRIKNDTTILMFLIVYMIK